jgi:hypothetical protein
MALFGVTYTVSSLLRLLLPSKPRDSQATGDLVALTILTSAFNSPVKSLLDSIALKLLPSSVSYGEIRIYGQVGFGVGSVFTGKLLHYYGAGEGIGEGAGDVNGGIVSGAFRSVIRIHFAICLPVLVCVGLLRFVNAPPKGLLRAASEASGASKATTGTKKHSEFRKEFLEPIRSLLRPKLLLISTLTLLTGISSGFLENFSAIHLKALGATGNHLSLSRALSALGGVPSFYYSRAIANKIGVNAVLTATLASYSVRFFAYSCARTPLLTLIPEFLRGATFGIFWCTITSLGINISPKGMETTVLCIMNAAYGGLGQSFGALLGGYMEQKYGTVRMFYVAGWVLLATSFFVGSGFFFYERCDNRKIF